MPSSRCDDVTFVRRVHLDIIGQLPTPEEVRRFLADPAKDKREKLIDDLLRHPLHAAVWATKLCDITGADNRVLYDRAVSNMHDWFRNKLTANMPWDNIVLGVMTATTADGRSAENVLAEQKRIAAEKKQPKTDPPPPSNAKPWESGYALRNTLDVFFDNNKFRVQAGPDKGKIDPIPIAQQAATAFLGVRLECAECHKHPHDRWSQEDFLGFTLSFAYINRGQDPSLKKKVLQRLARRRTAARAFRWVTEAKSIKPRVLGGRTSSSPGDDPRLEVWK